MNDNTILRIKVPAHLYESVKKQLTINEAKGSSTPKGWTVVKEKKAPKDGMKKVEEDKGYMGTGYDSSEDMAVDMIKKETKEKDNSMENKTRTLAELKKAKNALDEKINKMEMESKAPMNEDLANTAMELFNAVKDLDAQAFMDIASKTLGIAPNELKNLFIPGAAVGGIGAALAGAARKDKKMGIKSTVKSVD